MNPARSSGLGTLETRVLIATLRSPVVAMKTTKMIMMGTGGWGRMNPAKTSTPKIRVPIAISVVAPTLSTSGPEERVTKKLRLPPTR